MSGVVRSHITNGVSSAGMVDDAADDDDDSRYCASLKRLIDSRRMVMRIKRGRRWWMIVDVN